jgi:hypothetical protein
MVLCTFSDVSNVSILFSVKKDGVLQLKLCKSSFSGALKRRRIMGEKLSAAMTGMTQRGKIG